MNITIREYAGNLDLGWNPGEPLNVVLVQPRYEVETDGPTIGLIKESSRAGQESLTSAVAEFIRHRHQRVPGGYDPIHAVILPEFAVPCAGVPELLDAMEQGNDGLLLVAGVERQTMQEYRRCLEDQCTVEEWKQAEIVALDAQSGNQDDWANAMLVAWKPRADGVKVMFQRKITPSNAEMATLNCGSAVHVLPINGARIAFSICSDMLNTGGSCPVVDALVQDFKIRNRPPLHAMVHIQYNSGPDHGLMLDGVKKLLVESPPAVGNLFVDCLVIRANVASECEEDENYGRSGVAVSAHRRDPGPPDCCHVHGDPLRHYDLRPRRASAFLLQTLLPAWIHSPSGAAGARPVMKGHWLPLKAHGLSIDFKDDAADVPEAYRFAAWRAFQRSCNEFLVPAGQDVNAQSLRAFLAEKYRDLRRTVWGVNGGCLRRWARDVFAFSRLDGPPGKWSEDPRSQPDEWDTAHLHDLRRIAASLALIHAGIGVEPSPDGTPSVLRIANGGVAIHCRVASGILWEDVKERVVRDTRELHTMPGDVYLAISDRGNPPKEASKVKIAGLDSDSSPTYGIQRGDAHSIGETSVTLVSVNSIEHAVLESKQLSVADLRTAVQQVLGLP